MGTTTTRPCRLQVNTTGAWRNVLDFDAGNGDEVMEQAAQLFALAPGAKLRIMGDASDTAPLMTWSTESGWRKWREAA